MSCQRTSASTGVHDSSSRSHAILRIYIQRNLDPSGEDSSACVSREGVLTLVDLAGSEHRIDSMHHSADRRKEGAGINASLMALKECIRARAAGQNASHQYRKSKLTMALKASFLFPSARTLIIATVSPASKDTEHSLNTLRHACIMDGQQDLESAGVPNTTKETRFVTGGTVEREECGEVDVTDVARKNMAVKKITGKDAGARTSNGNEVQLLESQQPETTERQIAKNRRASERRMFAKLSPEHKVLLTAAREKLGSVRRQHERLRRCKVEEAVEVDGAGLGTGTVTAAGMKKASLALESCPEKQFSRYGGSGVQSHSISASSQTKHDLRAEEEGKEKEKEIERQARQDKKLLFTKLKSSVYSSAEMASEALLKRQLVTLMKLNGFSALEINTAFPLCESDGLLEPSLSPRATATAISSRSSKSRSFIQPRMMQEREEQYNNPEVASASAIASAGAIASASAQSAVSRSMRPGRRQSVQRDRVTGDGELSDTSPHTTEMGPVTSYSELLVSADSDTIAFTTALQKTSNALGDARESDNEALQKKRLAAMNAAAAVESTALTRKSRQEQAKAVRDKLDADKRTALMKKLGRSCDAAPKALHSPRPRTAVGEDSADYMRASEVNRAVSESSTIPPRSPNNDTPSHFSLSDNSRSVDPPKKELGLAVREVDRLRVNTPSYLSHGGQAFEQQGSEILRSAPPSVLYALNARKGTEHGTGAGTGTAIPGVHTTSSRSRNSSMTIMKGQPHQDSAEDEVEYEGSIQLMDRQSNRPSPAGHSSSRDDIDQVREQGRRRGYDVNYRESSSANSNRHDFFVEESSVRRNREASGTSSTNGMQGSSRELNIRREMPARTMPDPQYDLRDYENHRQQQQQQQQRTNHDSYSDRDDSLNYSQSRLHQQQQQRQQQQQQQQHQQQMPRQVSRQPDQDPGNPHGTHCTQGTPRQRQRLSIQQQHKLEYDQNEAYRQAQQQQLAVQEQQQRLVKEQEQEHSRVQQHYQSQRASDPDPAPIRHLRSNPSAQRHVGAAAAPWANELTWDRDRDCSRENES